MSYRRPRCCIRAVGMHDPMDLRHLAVDVTMRSRVGRGLVIPLDYPPLAVHDYHGLGYQVLVLEAGRLDDYESGLASRPLRFPLVQATRLRRGNSWCRTATSSRRACSFTAPSLALRWITFKCFITSFSPRPK